MLTKLDYNFKPLEDAMSNFRRRQTSDVLNDIKSELNKFFKDSKCKEIIFTKNTDKPLFGMCVIPYITGDLAAKILATDEKERLNEYYLELDSKLLQLGFTSREYVAMLLHEIGHVVNDSLPVEEVRKAIDFYLHSQDENLIITKSMQYRDIMAFGVKQAIRNLTSMFMSTDEEMKADEFSIACGYGADLESAFRKIISQSSKLNKGVPKLSALQWTLRLYKNVRLKRIAAIHTINKCSRQTGSVLEKRELDVVKRSLNQIDDSSLIHEGFADYMKEFYSRFKYKGIRALEDEMYEIALGAKNVDETPEAQALIRKINTNLAIIDDYLNSEKDNISDSERKKCFDMMNKYRQIRDDISKKTTYDNKYYGLFVKTPEIKSRYEF